MSGVQGLFLQRKLLIQRRADLCAQEMGVWRKTRGFLGKASLDEPGPPKGCAALQMVPAGPFQLSCLTPFCPVLSVTPGATRGFITTLDLILPPQPLEKSQFPGAVSRETLPLQQGGEAVLPACFQQENPYMVGKFVKGRTASISDRVST